MSINKRVQAKSLKFKKVVYKDKWTAESFPITMKPDLSEFHTIGLYETGQGGEEQLVAELDQETFKQVVRDFIILQIKNS
jgi:hypothetical protein